MVYFCNLWIVLSEHCILYNEFWLVLSWMDTVICSVHAPILAPLIICWFFVACAQCARKWRAREEPPIMRLGGFLKSLLLFVFLVLIPSSNFCEVLGSNAWPYCYRGWYNLRGHFKCQHHLKAMLFFRGSNLSNACFRNNGDKVGARGLIRQCVSIIRVLWCGLNATDQKIAFLKICM